ncbi:MAG: hypothetical protein Q6363_001660 [Candidatus Njordarchaeota archaeon]
MGESRENIYKSIFDLFFGRVDVECVDQYDTIAVFVHTSLKSTSIKEVNVFFEIVKSIYHARGDLTISVRNSLTFVFEYPYAVDPMKPIKEYMEILEKGEYKVLESTDIGEIGVLRFIASKKYYLALEQPMHNKHADEVASNIIFAISGDSLERMKEIYDMLVDYFGE